MPSIRWTSDQAREAGRKSAALRKLRREAQPGEERTPELSPNAQPGNHPNGPDSVALPEASGDSAGYVERELASVRKQIRVLSDRLDSELNKGDSLSVDRLARALASLRTQEQQLAGRPLPGAYRPEPPKRRNTLLDHAPGSPRGIAPEWLRSLPVARVHALDCDCSECATARQSGSPRLLGAQ